MTAVARKHREAPLDRDTAARRRVLRKLAKMTQKQLFALAVRAGIYTKKGTLTKPYRNDAEPSVSRPSD
jgi:hypothetical protein